MTDGKLICHSISANKDSSAVRLVKPKPFDTTGTKAEVIIEIQFDDKEAAKKYIPGKEYNLTITEED